MNPKAKTALLAALPLVIFGADRFFASAPVYVHVLALLLACALSIGSLFHVPASVVDLIASLLAAVTNGQSLSDTHPTVLAARRTLRRAQTLLPFAALAIALSFGGAPALVVLASSSEACNATPAQIGTTILDGLKLGGCIISQVLAGITDPAQLLACEGATEDLIIAAINDFTAQRPQPDGGLASVADLHGVTEAQRGYLAEARERAVTRKAARSVGK